MAKDINQTSTDDLKRREADSVWDVLHGNWNQMKGKVREKWGLLTGDDLEHIAGHKDRLIGKIQERYGKSKWNDAEIEREIRGL